MFVSSNSAKALVEVTWLLHTAFWIVVVGGVMVLGYASEWDDVPLMILGVSLAATTWLLPYLFISASYKRFEQVVESSQAKLRASQIEKIHLQRDAAIQSLTAMYLGVVTLSFGMNYFQTPFFFDVLHMKFGFKATWTIDRNPIFLYFLTVPYFSTYAACGCCAYRFVTNVLRIPPPLKLVTIFFIAASLAFAETLLNDNPFISNLFCYNDKFFALTFGSVCYGISFVFALPVWLWVGVPDGKALKPSATSALRHVMANAAVVVADAAVLFVVRELVAPHFTTVVPHAHPRGGCLTKEPLWNVATFFS
jgi:hypothetical protein